MVIEYAFGRLKARFGCFQRAMNSDELPYVIYACFVLHNFCEVKKEKIGENKVVASIAFDKHFQPPLNTNNSITDSNEAEGKRVRRVPSIFILDHFYISQEPAICYDHYKLTYSTLLA